MLHQDGLLGLGGAEYFGISSREYTIRHLSRQKDEAVTVLVNRFATPDIRCFYAEDGEASYATAELSVNTENALVNQIQTIDSDAVIGMLRDFFRSKEAELREKPHANKGPSSPGYGFSCGHVWM